MVRCGRRPRRGWSGLVAAGLVLAAIAACSDGGTDEATSTDSGAADGAPTSADRATGTESRAVSSSGPPVESTAASRCTVAADDTGPTVLHVWHALAPDAADVLTRSIDEFEAEHPSSSVELEEVSGGYNEIIARLRATPVDERPDVVMASPSSARAFADSGQFVPVSECTGRSTPGSLTDLLPVVATTFTVDGTLWAAPYNISTPVLMYDKARWRAAGLDPDVPPTTVEALEAVVRQLRDSGTVTTGIALYDRSASWFVTNVAAREDLLLASPDNGHGTVDVTAVDLDHPEVVDALTRLKELKQEGYVAWLGWDTGPDGADDLLQLIHPLEPSGMTLHTSASLGALIALQHDAGSFDGIEVGVGPFPTAGAGTLVGGGGWWLLDSGDPARVGAAWSLTDWVTQPDRVAALAAATGYVPTTERAAENAELVQRWTDEPVLRVAFDQLRAATDAPVDAGLQVGPGVEVEREIELAAAFTIDAGNDASAELQLHGDVITDLLAAYAATGPDTSED